MTFKLESLQSNKGSRRKKLRKGRGIAAGQGASCGFGMRGQKSRSGRPTRPGFEGGQMPLYQRLPKRGFNNINAKRYAVINLGILQKFIDSGKLDTKSTITEEALLNSGLVRRIWDGVRLLNKGHLTSKINIEVTGVSKTAVEAIEKAGGKVMVKITKPAPADS